MKHNCNYCSEASNKTRDELNDAGWSFFQLYAPKKQYFTSCPKAECQAQLAIATQASLVKR